MSCTLQLAKRAYVAVFCVAYHMAQLHKGLTTLWATAAAAAAATAVRCSSSFLLK